MLLDIERDESIFDGELLLMDAKVYTDCQFEYACSFLQMGYVIITAVHKLIHETMTTQNDL